MQCVPLEKQTIAQDTDGSTNVKFLKSSNTSLIRNCDEIISIF